MTWPRPLLALPLAAALAACGDSEAPVNGCEPDGMPEVTLGEGAGGAFFPFEDGQEVTLISAPQGGMGVSIKIKTVGLRAGPSEGSTVTLDVEREGVNEGTFTVTGAILMCTGDNEAGQVTDQAVGFDPEKYPSNDALIDAGFDGALVDLVVEVTDSEGNSAAARQPVTIRIGAGGP